ncbi:MAG: 2,3-bisphosphoglycerate-independent phosphoglycerate mutase [Polyangiaceae bacterium]|nr:2,3-bisphosphoglycerate-independent phosphoglycerate mutase [Polyangiaceae bacterium]
MDAPRKTGPVVLCLLDGVGDRDEAEGNAVRLAKTPHLDGLAQRFARTNLSASGEAVGFAADKPGTGALGCEAIGTGRVPRPASAEIDRVIASKKFGENKIIERAMWIAADRKCRLHLFMPLSDASAHASMSHLHTLLRVCEANDARVCVHVFLEERPSAPKSATRLLDSLLFSLEERGTIGTISGASFAMDRSGDWEATKRVYEAIVRGSVDTKETVHDALRAAYDKKRTDGTIEPVRIGDYEGMKGDYMADFTADKLVWQWIGEEAGMFLFHRPDRARQLASMFVRQNIPEDVVEFLTERGKPVRAFDEFGLLSLTEIDPALEHVLAAFPRQPMSGTLGEATSGASLSGLRIATADRAMHVSRFFDGGVRSNDAVTIVAEGEQAAAAERALREGTHAFVVVNFGAADRAARRGDLGAAIEAIEAIDAAIGTIASAAEAAGGVLFVVGTHGAAEEMIDAEGKPRGLHTTNPTPFFYANPSDTGASLVSGGQLADVAPTVLDVLGIAKPEAMTGRSLRSAR